MTKYTLHCHESYLCLLALRKGKPRAKKKVVGVCTQPIIDYQKTVQAKLEDELHVKQCVESASLSWMNLFCHVYGTRKGYRHMFTLGVPTNAWKLWKGVTWVGEPVFARGPPSLTPSRKLTDSGSTLIKARWETILRSKLIFTSSQWTDNRQTKDKPLLLCVSLLFNNTDW